MAVQMATQRGRNFKRNLSVPEETENKLSSLPDKKDRLFDVELGVLMLNGYLRTSHFTCVLLALSVPALLASLLAFFC